MFASPTSGATPRPDDWRSRLDEFARTHARELAALYWGLRQEWGDAPVSIGIDLRPQPHFVSFPNDALETLNQQANDNLREILGIVEHHAPETEVLLVAIGEGQLKLVHYEPDLAPPECYAQLCPDLDRLLADLEGDLQTRLRALSSS